MSVLSAEIPSARANQQARSAMRIWVDSAKHNYRLLGGAAIILIVALAAIFAPLLTKDDPNFGDFGAVLAGPSSAHWFGTDSFGRDVFARVLYGYRVSMVVAIGSVAVAVLIGLPLGLIAGYFGNALDTIIMRTLDLLMAFPPILLAITLIAVYGTGTNTMILALAMIYIPIVARVLRAAVMAVRNEEYIEAARSIGARPLRIMFIHALPNSLGPLIVQASISMGLAILIEAALSFIGLGTQPPDPSLGSMLAEGREFMRDASWVVIFPGLAIMLAVLGFNLFGDGLKDSLDGRS
jgi:peptide/nickel transport system permease protein